MKLSDLKPASQLAQKNGVKVVIYGAPGTAKTPLIKTAPRPVICAVEPGMMTMRDSNIPCCEAYTPEAIEDFFTWFFSSKEASNFDTLGIDSISQLCEVFLTQEFKRNTNKLKAYGDLSRRVMDLMNALYYFPNKHIYMVAKQATTEENGMTTKKPYFPGQDLNVKIPHLFDEIWHIGKTTIPGQQGQVLAIRTVETFGVLARDRSGKLSELEFPDLGALFSKCMS